VGSFSAQLSAVESGLGIAVLPRFAARRAGLVPVLKEVLALKLDLWLLVQEHAAQITRVKLVKEYLVKVLRQNKTALLG
jgi:DNA-binding transcriptional LysR family regulator